MLQLTAYRAATNPPAAAAAAAIPAAKRWPIMPVEAGAAAELDDVVGTVPDPETERVGGAVPVESAPDPEPRGAEVPGLASLPELGSPPVALDGVRLEVCVTGITVSDDELGTEPGGEIPVEETGPAAAVLCAPGYAVVVAAGATVDGGGGGGGGGAAVRRAWTDCSRSTRLPR